MALRTRSAYNRFRSTGGRINEQSSYAATLARRQMAAEDDYYDNAYTNGQISADRYLSVLAGRQTRTTNSPLQKQNLVQKIEEVTKDYQDAQVQTAYKTGGTYQGKPVDDQFMIDWEQAKLDKMTPDNTAYQKQLSTVDSFKNKKVTNDRRQYRIDQELKISNMRENTSTELMAKANMYGELEARARADGAIDEADKYLTAKNNLQQSADRAATNERIQAVQVANSTPVTPQSSFTTPQERSAAESGLAGGQVPTSDPQSVIREEVAMAKEAGFTDPSQIQTYLNNKYPGIEVTEGQIAQAMTEGLPIPTITPQIVTIAGIDLDKKVYDRIKISREVTSFLDTNAKTLKEIKTIDKTISSQKSLVDVLARELGNAKADNRPELQKQYNDAVEKYNGYIQRRDDLFTKAEQQQTDFPEVISKKAATIMKEQDKEFENGLQTSIDTAKEQLRSGKISKEEYISQLHGIAGTPFEGVYKQQLVTQLNKKGVKVDMNVPFDKIVTQAISSGVKSDGDIVRDLYGLYGLADQTYALRGDLYSKAGDPNLAIDTRNKAIEYQKQKEVLQKYVVPNMKNIRIVQNTGGTGSQNLANLKGSYKKGDFIMVDPTADATKNGVSPEEALKEFDNSHITLDGKSFEVAPNTMKSTFKNDFAKMSDAEKKNEYIYKQIDPNTGKEKAVEVRKVDYGDGRTQYVQKDMTVGGRTYKLDDMIKSGYYVQQGDKLVRNYNMGAQKGNPFLDATLGVVKEVAKALPFIGPPIAFMDSANKIKKAKEQKNQAQSNGFLNQAKEALIGPVMAGETKATPVTDIFEGSPKWYDGMVGGVPSEYKQMILSASQATGVPTSLLSALLKAESNFNPNAKSPVGATGIAQFMPETAKGMGIDPSDPEQAIMGAAKYLSGKYQEHGKNWDLALAAYNAGSGNVNKYGGIPPFPETQNYVKKINDSRSTLYGSTETLKKPGYEKFLPTPTPTSKISPTSKPATQVSTAPVKSAGVAEAYKPKSFLDQAWEGISNFIAPPVSGQTSNQQSSSSGGGQLRPSVSVPNQVVSQAAVRTQSNPAQQASVASAYRSPNVTTNPYTQQSVYKPPQQSQPKPQPQQNFVQKAVNTVKNWWSSIWR